MANIPMSFIERKLTERYVPHIDVGDRQFNNPDQERKAELSAALAALALQSRIGCDIETACASVVDGSRDHGIDAIGIDSHQDPTDIYFVQAKWSDDGRAGFGEKEARDFLAGVDTIVHRKFDQVNDRIRAMRSDLEAAMNDLARVHLVIAVARPDGLHINVETYLDGRLTDWNHLHPMYDWDLFTIPDSIAMLRDDKPRSVDVMASFEDYLCVDDPFLAYTGTVDVGQLAGWYEEYRDRLLDRNIRFALPQSEVNVGIQQSLEQRPEWFWYLSNGITVVCDRIDSAVNPTRRGRTSAGNNFRLIGASIVNGAQTISAIRAAMASDTDVQDARVLVKVISLQDAPPDLGERVTIATNTQNKVEERDFKSNDPVQRRLRDDFQLLEPPRSFVIKRGETVPDDGLGIEEAARALAATFRDPRLAADARRAPSSLWGSEHYRRLFGRRDITAPFVWRSVGLLRAVEAQLAGFTVGGQSARTINLANYGNLLITHVVHRRLGKDVLKAAEPEWTAKLAELPTLVTATFATMLAVIDAKYGRRSHIHAATHNPDKAFEVVTETLARLDGQDPESAVAIAQEQQRRIQRGRSTNAVRLIVEDGRIPDGTELRFTLVTNSDRSEMKEWLAADESRGRAIWRNNTVKPLKWEHDGGFHSTSGLTKMMRIKAYGNDQQVQGTKYWYVPGRGTLAQLADQIRAEQDFAEEE